MALAAGYPLIAYIATALDLPSRPLSIAFRAVALAGAVFLVICGLADRRAAASRGNILLLTFWLIYICRIIIDISILDVERSATQTPFQVYSFAIGASFLPILAIALHGVKTNVDSYLKILLVLLFVQSSLIISILIQEYGLNPEAFAVRQFIGDEDGDNVLNPISLARTGGQLFGLSVCWLAFRRGNVLLSTFLFVCVLMGLYLVLVGGSRGPLIAVGIGGLLISAYYLWLRGAMGVVYYIVGGMALVGLIISQASALNISTDDLAAVSRVQSTIESEDEDLRITMWRSALTMFSESPILGKAMFERIHRFHPHNILVESLMAIGILGTLPFLGAILACVVKFFRYAKAKASSEVTLGILVLLLFIGWMTSGNISEGSELWVPMAYFLSLPSVAQARATLSPNA